MLWLAGKQRGNPLRSSLPLGVVLCNLRDGSSAIGKGDREVAWLLELSFLDMCCRWTWDFARENVLWVQTCDTCKEYIWNTFTGYINLHIVSNTSSRSKGLGRYDSPRLRV